MMRNLFALGALAALSQSTFALQSGTYTIGSASLEGDNSSPSKTLAWSETDGGDASPLTFTPKSDNEDHFWFFTPVTFDSERDFLINSTFGGYINCGDEPGSPCFIGEEAEVYTAELAGDNTYELVLKRSGYFLRADGVNLQIAAWDQSPNEQFILTPAE